MGGIVRGKCPTQNGRGIVRGKCPGNCSGGNCPYFACFLVAAISVALQSRQPFLGCKRRPRYLPPLRLIATSVIPRYKQGRRPMGGLGDGPPQNLRWGDRSCIGPPNILRISVVGCA